MSTEPIPAGFGCDVFHMVERPSRYVEQVARDVAPDVFHIVGRLSRYVEQVWNNPLTGQAEHAAGTRPARGARQARAYQA